MPNYQNGKIYAIRSFMTSEYYIGSTTQPLCKRFQDHKFDVLSNRNKTSAHLIMKYEDAYIELIEYYPCSCKEELLRREGEIQRKYKEEIVNKAILSGLPKKEYKSQWYNENREHVSKQAKERYQNNRDKKCEYSRDYGRKHKEEIREKQKQYRDDNKEIIKEKQKQYRDDNKEIIKEKKKQYRDDNKEKIKEKKSKKYTCELCNEELCYDIKARHNRTQKHQDNLTISLFNELPLLK